MGVPEPFSITVALLGIIGFFSTVRDGIQKLHDDAKSWTKLRDRCDFYLTRWKAWQKRLVNWRNQYMVWEEDDELFAELWGDDWTTITEFVREVYKVSENVETEISSLARPTAGVAKELRYKGRKLKYIFWKQKPLDASFSSLDNLIPQLESSSWTQFKSQHPEKAHHVAPTDAIIHEVGNAFQLVRLANATQSISQALYRPCLDVQKKYNMNMELNFFGVDVANSQTKDIAESPNKDTATSRSKAISLSAKAGEIHFTFLANVKSDPLIRTRLKNDMSIAVGDCERSISNAFKQVFRTRANAPDVIGFETYPNGPRFRVKEVQKEQEEPLQPESYQRFRTILFQQQPYPITQRGRHMDLTKIKAAFELIECGLLLLRTQWLSRFCSCSLRRRGRTTEQHEYLLGAKGKENNNPKEYCWCQYMQNANLPLRYLGLLLVEIALGQPVNDLKPCPDPQDALQENYPEPFLLGFPSATIPPAEYFTVAETLVKVGQASGATSNAYVDAVEHCLKSDWTREEVQESQLKTYYWNVLAP